MLSNNPACRAIQRGQHCGSGIIGIVITLNENEERLVEALRSLPPDAVDQVITWTTRLRDLANGRNIDWSDTWTKEDLVDAQRASLSRFDEMEREEY
jgi:hypothetical protein